MSDEPTELDADRVAVRASGLEFSGWTGVQIDTSIEDACSTFSLEIAGVYATSEGFLQEGQPCEVWVGEDHLITGRIDRIKFSGDAKSEGVTVTGRSRTRNVADCSAPLGTWSGLKLFKLLQTLLAAYKIEVVDEAGVADEIVRLHRTEEGESLFDAVDRLGRDLNFLATDDTLGRLVLTRAAAGGRTTDKIVRGTTGFLKGDIERSVDERFSDYLCKGQNATDDEVDVDASGAGEDGGIDEFRQLIVKPERGVSKKGAAARARWEASTRAAKALDAAYELRGWRQTGGALWRKNQLVEVVDGFARLVGVDLLIVGLSFMLDSENGRRTAFKLAPAEAFTPPPGKMVDVSEYAQAEDAELELTDPQAGEEGED